MHLTWSHYLLRKQLVSELEKRANLEHGCSLCRPDSALQLALIFETALGTGRDQEKCEYWLKVGGKRRKDLRSSFQEIAYDTEHSFLYTHDLVTRRRCFGLNDPSFIELSEQYSIDNLSAIAMSHYENEIQGRRASKVGTRSLTLLHNTAAEIAFSYHDFETAEMHWAESMRVDKMLDPWRKIRKTAFFGYNRNDYYAYPLALALYCQNREDEANSALGNIKILRHNPNGREPFFLFHRDPENRTFAARIFLSHLLVKQNRLDEAIKLDLVADLADALDFRGRQSSIIKQIKINIYALVRALQESNRVDDAVSILHNLRRFLERRFGLFEPEVIAAVHELTWIFASAGSARAKEAMVLPLPEREETTSEKFKEVTLQLIVRAFAFHRMQEGTETMKHLERALELIKTKWTLKDYTAEGCWRGFGTTFTSHGKIDQELLNATQTELLQIAGRLPQATSQETLIRLVYKISHHGSLRGAIALLKDLVDTSRANHLVEEFDQQTIQVSYAFMLSIIGYHFDDIGQIDKSLDVCGDAISLRPESIRARRLLAAVYSKKGVISFQLHGYYQPRDDPWIQRAEDAHRKALDLVTSRFGPTHEVTMDAMEQLAVVLSRHGSQQKSQAKLLEAIQIFSELMDVIDSELSNNNGSMDNEVSNDSGLVDDEPSDGSGSTHNEPSNGSVSTDNEQSHDNVSIDNELLYGHDGSVNHRTYNHRPMHIRVAALQNLFYLGRQTAEQNEILQQAFAIHLTKTLGKGVPDAIAQWGHVIQLKLNRRRLDEARVMIANIIEDFRTWRQQTTAVKDDYHPLSIRLLGIQAQSLLLDGNNSQAVSTLKYVVRLAKSIFPGGEQHPRTLAYRDELTRAIGQAAEADTGGS